MPEIIRNRVIRPSTRLESSKNYKINTEKVYSGDTLIVNITHESTDFTETYKFDGAAVTKKASISFRVIPSGTDIQINWIGATPLAE